LGNLKMVRGTIGSQAVLVCPSGMGKGAAEVARVLLSRYIPKALVSLGLGGATRPGLSRGQVFLAHRIVLWGDEVASFATSPYLRGLAEEAALRAQVPLSQGLSCTVLRVMTTPQQKSEVAALAGADMVQMEDYWLAREASAHDVPFVALRAVADALDDRLPVGPDGNWRWNEVVSHPLCVAATVWGALLGLWRLRRVIAWLMRLWG